MDNDENTGNNTNNPPDGGESDLPLAPGYGPLRGQDLGRHPDSASASAADDYYVRQSSNSAGYGNSDGSSFRPRPSFNKTNNSSLSDNGLPPPPPTTSGRSNDRNEASTSKYDHQNSNTAKSNRASRDGSKSTAQDNQHSHFIECGYYNAPGPSFDNLMGVTDDLPPPSYPQGPQSVRENISYKSSGYHPGPPMPYPPPVQANQGWASNQTTQPIVNQAAPSAVIIKDPASSIPDHFALSCIVTFLFCFVIGLYAIHQSSEAQRLREIGSLDRARVAARGAFKTSMVGIAIGIIIMSAGVLFGILHQQDYI